MKVEVDVLGSSSRKMPSSSRCLLYTVLAVLYVANPGCGQSFKDFYNQLWRVRGSRTKETMSPPRPPLSLPSPSSTSSSSSSSSSSTSSFSSSSTDTAGQFNNGLDRWRAGGLVRARVSPPRHGAHTALSRGGSIPAVSTGQSYREFYSQRRGGVWGQGARTTASPRPRPVVSTGRGTDTAIPGDLADLLPPGMTVDDLPKSQLAGTGGLFSVLF